MFLEDLIEGKEWSLSEGIDAVSELVRLFFQNEFDLSKQKCQQFKDVSLYHSMGMTYHTYVYAIFTMEKVGLAVPN